MPRTSAVSEGLRTLLHPGPDSADYGMGGRRSEWLDVDWAKHRKRIKLRGREVEYVELGTDHEDAVVVIHGLGANWQTFLENIPFFAETHHVIGLDLPGFGRSEMPAEDISIPFFADIVDELCAATGIRAATVIGNSMGGFVGAELAIRHPERVEQLVLVSPAILWQEQRRAKPLMAFARASELALGRLLVGRPPRAVRRRPRLRAGVIALGGIRYPHLLSRELQQELLLTVQRTDGFLPSLLAFGNYPVREELPQIKCPVLVVWGTDDTLVGVKHADELVALMPEARKVIMERTGHVAMLERPDRFNRIVAEFMAESGDASDDRARDRARAADAAPR
jgi:pimeloyl-ACP methyl ester carboxylesterase